MDIEFVPSLADDINAYVASVTGNGATTPQPAQDTAYPTFLRGRGGVGADKIRQKRPIEDESALAKRLKYDRRKQEAKEEEVEEKSNDAAPAGSSDSDSEEESRTSMPRKKSIPVQAPQVHKEEPSKKKKRKNKKRKGKAERMKAKQME